MNLFEMMFKRKLEGALEKFLCLCGLGGWKGEFAPGGGLIWVGSSGWNE